MEVEFLIQVIVSMNLSLPFDKSAPSHIDALSKPLRQEAKKESQIAKK